MRVIVCGPRDHESPAQVYRSLDEIHAKEPITEFMQGGCPTGVDLFAKEWARTKPNIKRFECKAQWVKYGRAAGPKRNTRMLEWKPDRVIAFWPGGPGTKDMVRQAEGAGVPVTRVPR